MKLNPTAIPPGTRTYLFEEASYKRFIEDAIHIVLRSRGFQEIVTPPFEYHESAIVGLNEDERNRLIRFTEADSGRIIALRADVTSQVARSAATHLSSRPLPLRLCYSGMVFRRARKGQGEQYVFNQSGFEIIGSSGYETDTETILSLTDVLWETGFSKFSISLGHAGFIASFLEGFSEADAEKIKRSLGKKDKTELEKILASLSVEKGRSERIVALASLFGNGDVLTKAEGIAVTEGSKKALYNLKSVYAKLEEAGLAEMVTIDLGEMRGFGYYTGINIEVFSPSGISVGHGGRYDNLVKRFGADLPAVGFAFDIDSLIEAARAESLLPEWRGSDILVLADGDEAEDAVFDLRESGANVTVPFGEMKKDEGKEYARRMNIPLILLPGKGEGEFNVLDVNSGKEQKVAGDELVKYLVSMNIVEDL
ncbi:MAG: ATP phosphoribosyltransferase regulatory subunit [Nitrospinota bacterium]|nr:ATP phosphoribosyltransferase regulatory subunit [Nitrospinota bacterium]